MFPQKIYCLVSFEPTIESEYGYGKIGKDIASFTVIAVDECKERLERLKLALETKRSRFDHTEFEIREALVGESIDHEYYRAVEGKYCFGDLPEEYKWNK